MFDLVETAEREGYTPQLLIAARQSNPGNEQLVAAAQAIGLSSSNEALEKKVRELPLIDISQWRARLGIIEGQVCKVETPGSSGTGFLVGPRTVLTNYHVMQNIITGAVAPTSVVLRFDYRRGTDGSTLHPGTEFRLTPTDWLVDSCRYSDADLVDNPTRIPAEGELDYALLRVEGEPGNLPISAANAEPGSPARGFIQIPTGSVGFLTDQPIMIVQHPNGAPLKLAFDTQSVVFVNSNRTRVRYRTNTEGGSSGSPVFDVHWNLVALHHAGDPTSQPSALAQWNQGIPIDTIRACISRRGHDAAIG